jgi:transcriptional regulator with XRE-family HTH domain
MSLFKMEHSIEHYSHDEVQEMCRILARSMSTKVSDPVDRYVGSRVRLRRRMLRMSQKNLGHKLGITFQQVQKYEKGANRVSASRLQMISTALDVPVGQFFTDGAGTSRTSVKPLAFDPQALRFAEAFIRLNDRALRNSILDMVEAMARQSSRI